MSDYRVCNEKLLPFELQINWYHEPSNIEMTVVLVLKSDCGFSLKILIDPKIRNKYR